MQQQTQFAVPVSVPARGACLAAVPAADAAGRKARGRPQAWRQMSATLKGAAGQVRGEEMGTGAMRAKRLEHEVATELPNTDFAECETPLLVSQAHSRPWASPQLLQEPMTVAVRSKSA